MNRWHNSLTIVFWLIKRLVLQFYCGRAVVRSCSRAVVQSCSCAVVQSCSRAIVQPCSRAVVQSCSRAIVQSCSRAVVQSCSRAVMQSCSHAVLRSCGLEIEVRGASFRVLGAGKSGYGTQGSSGDLNLRTSARDSVEICEKLLIG